MEQTKSLSQLLKKFGISPKDLSIYQTAFTHPSVHGDKGSMCEDYERLEFLGDAVIGVVISYLAFIDHPELDQGGLSQVKRSFTRGHSEALYAKKYGFKEYIRLGKSFRYNSKNEVKVLEDVFESFIGATFIDQGKEFTFDLLIKMFGEDVLEASPEDDPKTILQECLQAERESFVYKILDETGPANDKRFLAAVYVDGNEYGRGEGTSKQMAETEAARDALSKFVHPLKGR